MKTPSKENLRRVYGEEKESCQRYEKLAIGYQKAFDSDEMEFFTAPGRTELIGNHTDHNGGYVLAASIDMDTIGAANKNTTNQIEIISEGYAEKIVIDLRRLESIPKNQGTKSLVAGMMKAISELGFEVGGFQAYLSTNVIAAAGVSSSASFEMLICTIVNYFYNHGKMTATDYAKVGQYAENQYWDKDSGLMDQMACAVGGAIWLDFSKGASYECLDFSFEKMGYELVIVNTGKGHADLSDAYSSIPREMKEVAQQLGIMQLSEGNMQQFMSQITKVTKELENDRAILRAMHFYQENERVGIAAKAIKRKDIDTLLQCITESGNSSWKYLQNCSCDKEFKEQKVALMLAMTEKFLASIQKKGSCRVHGGGFAGVLLCILPQEESLKYRRYMEAIIGADNIYPIKIRSVGAVHLQQ